MFKVGMNFLKKSIENLPCDIFISVAAISDWRTKKFKKKKLKKNGKKNIQFVLNDDVLKKYFSPQKKTKISNRIFS